MTTLPASRLAELDRVQRWALGVGVAACAVCVAGALFRPLPFFRAYLAAYLLFLGIGLGSMAILMLYHLTGGAWGFLVRHILEAAVRTLPLLAVLFTPVAFGVSYLYLWAGPDASTLRADLRRLYLNAPFFWGRAALFFVLWMILGYLLNSWSRKQDETGNPIYANRLSRISGPGLIVYGLSITFVAVDWVMSLEPHFRSTMFGPLVASGQLIAGQAFALLVLAWLLGRSPLTNVASAEALNDLGNLLFTFLVIWAYMAFFQYMLIWIANLPYDVSWYIPRTRDGWQWVATALFLFHFALPFFLLLLRDIKQDPIALARVGGLLLFMHLVYGYYEVLPALPGEGLGEHWIDVVTPLAIGGIWLAFFIWQLKRRPLLPRHDINVASAVHLRNLDQETAAREQEIRHA